MRLEARNSTTGKFEYLESENNVLKFSAPTGAAATEIKITDGNGNYAKINPDGSIVVDTELSLNGANIENINISDIKLKDTSDNLIDPATSQKQTDIDNKLITISGNTAKTLYKKMIEQDDLQTVTTENAENQIDTMTYSSVNLAAELEVSSIDIVETMTYHASGNIASTSRTVNIVSL